MMRLTLRTMLAYLDGVLDRVDAEPLGKKIQESEFASSLVQRIRDVTRRSRIPAPPVEGRGLGLDPNSVAEYLENCMPLDKVPEFERICLESDVHLAEVASCHQILTIVLRQTANIDPAVRERMYRIGEAGGAGRMTRLDSGVEGRGAPSEAAAVAAASTGAGSGSLEKASPEPARRGDDRLVVRAPRRSIWPMISTVALAFVITIVALLAMGKLDRSHPLYSLVFGEPSIESTDRVDALPDHREPVTAGEERLSDPGTERGDSPVPVTIPNEPPPADNPATAASITVPVERPAAIPGETNAPADTDLAPKPEVVPAAPSTTAPALPVNRLRPENDVPQDPFLPPARPAQTVPNVGPRATDAETTPVAPAAPDLPLRGAKPGIPSATAAPNVTVGRYISESQVLGSWDAKAEAWNRVPPDSTLRASDRLVSFPLFRPKLLLAPGFNLTFCGPSGCLLGPPDANGFPSLSLDYGRLAISTDGKPDLAIDFAFATRQIRVTFPDADSGLALEVAPYVPLGADPRETKHQLVAVAYATRGEVVLEDLAGGMPVVVKAGRFKWFLDDSAWQEGEGPPPDWVEVKSIKSIDDKAARDLEILLPTDRPLNLSLLERAAHRQPEVRALAIRCLSYLDEFQPLIEAINTEAQHSYCGYYFDALQAANARSPEASEKLSKELAKARLEEGEVLYRLIWGFSAEQLVSGSARQLVEYLEHKSMDVRVLASENLRRITQRTKNYRPEKPPEQMKAPIRSWYDALAAGEIAYKSPPSLLPIETK